MANLRQLYNLVSTLKELKREFIGKTRSFVDDNFPSYNKFLNDLKEKCKSEIKTQNPDVDSEKKTVLEKLFGKKKPVYNNIPDFCLDEKTYNLIYDAIKTWNQSNYYSIELSRDKMVQEISDKINEIENTLNVIINVLKNEKRYEAAKKVTVEPSSELAEPSKPEEPEEPEEATKPDLYLVEKIKEIKEKISDLLNNLDRKDFVVDIKNQITKFEELLNKKIILTIKENKVDDLYRCIEENIDSYNKKDLDIFLSRITIGCLGIPDI